MRDENMSYTVKSSERLRKSGSEAETKALLYLMNFRPDSDDIYYFVVDFYPVLYVQLFFIGQDKKDTSNIANHGFYNKQDFIDMLYAYAGLIGEQLPQERIDEIKSHIITLSDEKKLLLQQHKILKSKKTPVSYLSAESDRLAFGKKIESLERVQNKIAELRKARNSVSTRKSKWEHTINELRSLNRTR